MWCAGFLGYPPPKVMQWNLQQRTLRERDCLPRTDSLLDPFSTAEDNHLAENKMAGWKCLCREASVETTSSQQQQSGSGTVRAPVTSQFGKSPVLSTLYNGCYIEWRLAYAAVTPCCREVVCLNCDLCRRTSLQFLATSRYLWTNNRNL